MWAWRAKSMTGDDTPAKIVKITQTARPMAAAGGTRSTTAGGAAWTAAVPAGTSSRVGTGARPLTSVRSTWGSSARAAQTGPGRVWAAGRSAAGPEGAPGRYGAAGAPAAAAGVSGVVAATVSADSTGARSAYIRRATRR